MFLVRAREKAKAAYVRGKSFRNIAQKIAMKVLWLWIGKVALPVSKEQEDHTFGIDWGKVKNVWGFRK